MKRRKQQYATYEQVAALERQLQTLVEAQRRGNSSTSSNFLGAVVATTPAIDGRITLADCAVAAGVALGFVTTGVVGGAGSALITGDLSMFPSVWGGFAIAGAGLGALRLAGDALNLSGAWYAIYEPILDRLIGERPDDDEPEPQPEPGGYLIVDPGAKPVKEWCKLPATQRRIDVIDFANELWRRQEHGLGAGQKAFRESRYTLPSGFEIDDTLHSELLKILDDCGAITTSGKTWRIDTIPSHVAVRLKV